MKIDPKINFIPQFVLNYMVKTVAPLIFNKMLQKAMTIKGSKHELAMQDPKNEKFYKWLKIILDKQFLKLDTLMDPTP